MILKDFINTLKNKNIHIVGVTGSEGSSILRFLLKNGLTQITVHDFCESANLSKNYRLWHKGISTQEQTKMLIQFKKDIAKVIFRSKVNYLDGVAKADIVFVPQSWRLYKQNFPIFKVEKNKLFSLTRLYLDFSKSKIITVTGTVGKGSVAYMIYQYLKYLGKKVYFAGNETWMVQMIDKIDELENDSFLVLEVSHRQLIDGYSKSPQICLYTNIYPNHLDEMSWEDYKNIKISLALKQTKDQICILNYDDEVSKNLSEKIISNKYYYSENKIHMNTNNVQKYFELIMNSNKENFMINKLAVMTLLDVLDVPFTENLFTFKLKKLPARLTYFYKTDIYKFYDDIKSTTPYATFKALEILGKNTILICGGHTKNMDYSQFVQKIEKIKKCIIINSRLSQELIKTKGNYVVVANIEEAFLEAFRYKDKKYNILISPAAAFFYSEFIKEKKSLRSIIISLLPKEQV